MTKYQPTWHSNGKKKKTNKQIYKIIPKYSRDLLNTSQKIPDETLQT